MTVAEAKASIPISALWRQLGLPGTPGPRCNSPFRTDTKPSMSISADDTLWFDHGTGEGGDAVTFLEKACGIDNSMACQVITELALGFVGVEAQAEFKPPSSGRVRLLAELPLRAGTSEEITRLSTLRHLTPKALLVAQDRGILRFGSYRSQSAWFITEPGICIQARRLDGRPWKEIGAKAWNLPGSRAGHPIGINRATAPAIALVEGGPDLLAAFMFIVMESKVDRVSPVAMLGAGNLLPATALPHFSNKTVRIFPHADAQGIDAARRWTRQLHRVASAVEWFDCDGLLKADGQPVTDLNDLCYVERRTFEETSAGGIMP